jgi:TolA-binding protein
VKKTTTYTPPNPNRKKTIVATTQTAKEAARERDEHYYEKARERALDRRRSGDYDGAVQDFLSDLREYPHSKSIILRDPFLLTKLSHAAKISQEAFEKALEAATANV